LLFFITVPPHVQLFPSSAAALAGSSFIPSSLRPQASLVCTSATYCTPGLQLQVKQF
jgi:hypothetical protein